jgi:hypothetical protein
MSEQTTAQEIVTELIPDFHVFKYLPASEYIKHYWTKYKSNYLEDEYKIQEAVLNELIAITLIRRGIMPFYMQAKIAFIPNAIYDFVIYCEDIGPLALSAQLGMYEQYKQVDIGAVVLKNVHRKSESYIISLNDIQVNAKKRGLYDLMAINNFIYASSPEYDELLQKISEKHIIEAPTVQTVNSDNMITPDNFEARWT